MKVPCFSPIYTTCPGISCLVELLNFPKLSIQVFLSFPTVSCCSGLFGIREKFKGMKK
ncbi:hypothetical protein Fmac_014986 [Flemingia macrophylla]|uniref:Uncharacterized protein n=1 Tax=Flemingia macrophylla TaxID=520843 RepID=A0ABD1MDA3_9FABA